MKNIYDLHFLICIFALSSCSPSVKDSKQYVWPSTVIPKDFEIPYTLDLSSDQWLNYIYTYDEHKYLYQKWFIYETETDTYDYLGNKVPSNTKALRQAPVEAVPAGVSGPGLYFGNPELKNYNLKFDFLGDGISFSIYSEGLSVDYNETEKQGIYFSLENNKGLELGTKLLVGSHMITDEKNTSLLYNFDTSIWNTIELTTNDDCIHLYFNDLDYGVIFECDENQYGGAAFSCGTTSMIKNIQFVSNTK